MTVQVLGNWSTSFVCQRFIWLNSSIHWTVIILDKSSYVPCMDIGHNARTWGAPGCTWSWWCSDTYIDSSFDLWTVTFCQVKHSLNLIPQKRLFLMGRSHYYVAGNHLVLTSVGKTNIFCGGLRLINQLWSIIHRTRFWAESLLFLPCEAFVNGFA